MLSIIILVVGNVAKIGFILTNVIKHNLGRVKML